MDMATAPLEAIANISGIILTNEKYHDGSAEVVEGIFEGRALFGKVFDLTDSKLELALVTEVINLLRAEEVMNVLRQKYGTTVLAPQMVTYDIPTEQDNLLLISQSKKNGRSREELEEQERIIQSMGYALGEDTGILIREKLPGRTIKKIEEEYGEEGINDLLTYEQGLELKRFVSEGHKVGLYGYSLSPFNIALDYNFPLRIIDLGREMRMEIKLMKPSPEQISQELKKGDWRQYNDLLEAYAKPVIFNNLKVDPDKNVDIQQPF
jgi:hypothetical protein